MAQENIKFDWTLIVFTNFVCVLYLHKHTILWEWIKHWKYNIFLFVKLQFITTKNLLYHQHNVVIVFMEILVSWFDSAQEVRPKYDIKFLIFFTHLLSWLTYRKLKPISFGKMTIISAFLKSMWLFWTRYMFLQKIILNLLTIL